MLRRSDSPDDRTNDGVLDEAEIRADERARIQRRLEGDDAPTNHDDRLRDDRLPDDRLDRPIAGDHVSDDTYADDRHSERHDEPRVVEERVVEERPVEEIEVVRKRSFSFGQLLTMLVGAALVVLGIFALIATGLETPLDQPVEEVLGYGHTPLLGIIEVVAGALLVIFSLRPGGRWIVALVGLALILGGLLVFAELDWTVEELGAERNYAWIPIVAGAVALVSSLITPRRYQRMTGVPTQHTM